MKLYEEYCKAMYDRDMISNDHSFIVYKSFEDGSLYIHSIYTTPEARGKGAYLELEQELINKVKPSSIFCYVDTTANNPTLSLKAILKSGYTIFSTTSESIMLKKDM